MTETYQGTKCNHDEATEGYAYFNPDTGNEWTPDHPINSGQCDDATDIVAMTLGEFRRRFPLAEEIND